DLIDSSSRTVFLSSSSRLLRVLDLGENASPPASGALAARCDVPELENAGSVKPDRFFSPADGVTGCFSEDGAAGLLVSDRDGTRTALLEGASLLSNEHLAEN